MARIALDIDSTLHHYWDLIERIALDRFGVALPYADQRDWNVGELSREQLKAIVEETHSDANVEQAVPYDDAAAVVGRWHRAGHFIHVTSHRRDRSAPATRRWLEANAIPFDDLHCSFDKVPRCVELGIELLVDDSPTNIERALEEGILVATIAHPWNEALLDRDGVTGARTWGELESELVPVLARLDARPPGRRAPASG